MSEAEWIAYVLACIVVAAVPGPSVSLIVASSLRHGPGAGLANGHHEGVHQPPGAGDDVQVPIGHRIETARIEAYTYGCH